MSDYYGLSEENYSDLEWWFENLFQVSDFSIFEEEFKDWDEVNEKYEKNGYTAWKMFHDDINDAIDEYNEVAVSETDDRKPIPYPKKED